MTSEPRSDSVPDLLILSVRRPAIFRHPLRQVRVSVYQTCFNCDLEAARWNGLVNPGVELQEAPKQIFRAVS